MGKGSIARGEGTMVKALGYACAIVLVAFALRVWASLTLLALESGSMFPALVGVALASALIVSAVGTLYLARH